MTKKYYYEETGMYIDWAQKENLPDVDVLIDIGVGPDGTPWIWDMYKGKEIICIDPLDEAEEAANRLLKGENFSFHKFAVGTDSNELYLKVEEKMGRSTLLDVTEKNFEGEPVERRLVQVKSLDSIIYEANSKGPFGIKIDTEGYEYQVIKSASKTLKNTKFVIAEVRHNHITFKGQYTLGKFMALMQDFGFVPTMILTAKPFIADICFQHRNDI